MKLLSEPSKGTCRSLSDGGSSITIHAKIKYGPVDVGLSWSVKDGDDDLGNRVVDKSSVPWDGWHSRTTGDVSFQVDKDH